MPSQGRVAAQWLLLAALALLPNPAEAREEVMVGGYAFAPYVEVAEDGRVDGLTLELIALLNDSQDDYAFDFFLTSPARRFADFEAGRFDLIFFESPDWGWSERGLPVEASEVFLHDSEIFVAEAEPGRFQSYFWDLEGKTVAGMLGYHYAFAGYVSEPATLESDFGMILVNDNAAAIELVLRGRADLAVVTRSYLLRHLADHPERADSLLLSEIADQHYEHRALIRRGSRPSPGEIDALLQVLQAEGALEELWRRAGIAE